LPGSCYSFNCSDLATEPYHLLSSSMICSTKHVFLYNTDWHCVPRKTTNVREKRRTSMNLCMKITILEAIPYCEFFLPLILLHVRFPWRRGIGALSRNNGIVQHCYRSRVSSVSIVSDYGLDDRAIGVQSPAEAKDFSSNLCVQTGSEAQPASCTMGTRGPSPGSKSAAGA
jgi:hypothetical protein